MGLGVYAPAGGSCAVMRQHCRHLSRWPSEAYTIGEKRVPADYKESESFSDTAREYNSTLGELVHDGESGAETVGRVRSLAGAGAEREGSASKERGRVCHNILAWRSKMRSY